MPNKSPKEPISSKVALLKAASYCAYQERCHAEVLEKLRGWGLREDDLSTVMEALYADNFIDDTRFAQSFTRGRFYYKKWGRLRIRQGLKMKGVGEAQIAKGLAEIPEADYWQCLQNLAKEKWASAKAPDAYQKKAKVYRYLLQKGYESHLVTEVLADLA